MKIIQIVRPNELKLVDIKKPMITERDDVLVKMAAAGVYGSDVSVCHGANTAATYPRVIGHEMMGRVGEAGPGVADLKVGDRVTANQVTSCRHCYPCKIGKGNICDSLAVRGVHTDGDYGEYVAVPESDCHILPESLSDQDVIIIEPTTIGIQSYTRADLKKDDLLLICGFGAPGGSILKIARLLCDHIIVVGVVGDKLEAAKVNGATRTINVLKENLIGKVKEYAYGHGATVSIGAVCNRDSLINLLQTTDNTGHVIIMGFSTAPAEINQSLITSKELSVRGSRFQNKMFGKAIELINEGKLDFINSISRAFPLTKAREAFDFVDNHDSSIRKIILTFDF